MEDYASGWSEDNVIWLNTIIGDHSYATKIHARKQERTGNRALWIDVYQKCLKATFKMDMISLKIIICF